MKKKFISLLLVFALCLSMGTVALAVDEEPVITKIYLVQGGVWEEITYEEYMILTNGDSVVSAINEQPPQITPFMHTWGNYLLDSEYDYYASEEPVSYIVYGGISGSSITKEDSFSITVSASFSLAASFDISRIVKAESSISGSLALEAISSLSTTHNVTPGMYGRLYFRPHINRMIGTLETWVTYETGVSGMIDSQQLISDFPITVNGFADGIYFLKESTSYNNL